MFSEGLNNKAELSTQNTLNPENPAKVSIKPGQLQTGY